MIRAWGRVLPNTFSSNLITTNLMIFPNDGRMYRFEKKFNKYSRER